MNKQLRRLALVTVLLLVSLVVASTYWQAWAAGGLQDRQDNAIERVIQFTIKRGLIVPESKKVTFAANRKERVAGQTLYFRRYPTLGLARADGRLLDRVAFAVGSRGVDERLPHRLEHESLQRVAAPARPARRRHGEGEQPRADDRPVGAASRDAAARQTLRRGRRDEHPHRRDARARVDADVQPEPDRPAGRLREGAEDPRRSAPARRRCSTADDGGSLHAGLDVQDDHRRRRARHGQVHAGVALLRPGLLHRLRQAGVERGQPGPGRRRGVRQRHARARDSSTRSTPSSATSARRSARRRSSTTRSGSASTRRRRSRRRRTSARRAGSTSARGSSTRRIRTSSTPAGSRSGRSGCS